MAFQNGFLIISEEKRSLITDTLIGQVGLWSGVESGSSDLEFVVWTKILPSLKYIISSIIAA